MCPFQLDKSKLENDLPPAGSSSARSSENIQDYEAENDKRSPQGEFQMDSMTHLPDAAENQQNISAMASSLNQHKETTDNASVEVSAAGESVLREFQGEEQSQSNCNKTETAHSKGPGESFESFTRLDSSQTDTDLRDSLAENHASSQFLGTGHEKEKQTQCLDSEINDKEGQKVRATIPQVDDLLSCSLPRKNKKADGSTSEAVRSPEQEIDDDAIENDLLKSFNEKCSLKGLLA